MESFEAFQELQKEVEQLKQQVRQQKQLIEGTSEWEGNDLYAEVDRLQTNRQERQSEYKRLMKDHFQFVRNGTSLQQGGEGMLEEKLRKNVGALTREIEAVLESRTSKSSLSSCSMFDKVESMDWLLQDRQNNHIKEQHKIKIEIMELEKILESIKRIQPKPTT